VSDNSQSAVFKSQGKDVCNKNDLLMTKNTTPVYSARNHYILCTPKNV